MKNTFFHSGSGKQNIAIGPGAIAEQVNFFSAIGMPPTVDTSMSFDELKRIYKTAQEKAQGLNKKAQKKAENAFEGIRLFLEDDEPDKDNVVGTLNIALKVLHKNGISIDIKTK